MSVTRIVALALLSPACSASVEVDSCDHAGDCEETGLVQLRRMKSSSEVGAEDGGICCYDGCGVAPTSCNPAFDPSHPDGNGHCSQDSGVCASCAGTYCPAAPSPPSPPAPSPAGGSICCYTGCSLAPQGCNPVFDPAQPGGNGHCSESKEICESAGGKFCDAPALLEEKADEASETGTGASLLEVGPEEGGICCYNGCGVAPTSCNPAFDPSHPGGNGHCSQDSGVCASCAGTYCPASPSPPSPPAPSPAGGSVCCYTGCSLAPQGCNPVFDPAQPGGNGHCSESAEVCKSCSGQFCDAPALLEEKGFSMRRRSFARSRSRR